MGAPNLRRAARAHAAAWGSLLALFVLCVIWEWWLAPIRAGGSWLILKAFPLLWPIWQLWRKPQVRRYQYQLSTLLIWFYFTEGAVRAWSDIEQLSRLLALIEAMLCVAFFVAAIIFIRATPSHLRATKAISRDDHG